MVGSLTGLKVVMQLVGCDDRTLDAHCGIVRPTASRAYERTEEA